MPSKDSIYDVVITGGGLAGLTLALQLKKLKPAISILILEKRKENASAATHKVGESFSELAAYYFREVLGLKDYLCKHQLNKFGFRYFFSPEYADDITKRVELGSKIFNPFPSHQVDRGLLENDMVGFCADHGVEILLRSKVTEIELAKDRHCIQFERDGMIQHAIARWIVDASGRSSLLRRKLKLEKEINHNINAAWFRFDVKLDIDYWSENLEWRNFVKPGHRWLATNHFVGEGYWVWFIPLLNERTSVGIVADPRHHPFSEFNTFDKAMNWLQQHEPHAARMLAPHWSKQMDFKVMKDFAYDAKQFFSSEKWALAGEAAAFLDPLYSPGYDFIALSNTWIIDLIVRETNGEDVAFRVLLYDHAYKQLVSGWASIYIDMYGLLGNTQVLLMKIIWDWASYWAVPIPLFVNKGYIDISIMKQYASTGRSIGRRFALLNDCMQQLFLKWAEYPFSNPSGQQLNVFSLECMHRFQSEIGNKYEHDQLIPKVESNMLILEQIAAEIFRRASNYVHGTPINMRVDPYAMRIEDGREALLQKSNADNALDIFDPIRRDIGEVWLLKTKTPEHEYTR
jgi:flavin-dependent dehydrogenase